MQFYHPIHEMLASKLNNGAFPVRTVGDICEKITDGPFGSHLKVEEYQETGIPLIRVSNVRSGVVEGDFVFISEEKQMELKRSRVLPSDVLLTKAGAILGYSAVFPEHLREGNITSHLVTIRCKEDIIPEYLAIFFQSLLGQRQIYRWGNKSTRPELNTSEVKRIMISLPPPDIQNHIISIIQSAYAQKRQKGQEADVLLDSIDDYLLGQLGIELPKPNDNTVENRIFTTTFSGVSGRRIDPEVYYQVYSLYTESYPMERLQDCVLINPQTSFYGYELDTSITFVPMEKVSARYGEADLSLCKLIREAQGYTKFRENDLIWAKITPCMENGKSAVVDNLKGSVGCGSTEFHVFRALEGINIRYIHALLRLKSLREHAVLHFTGSAGQQRVPSEFFKDLIIPKPPIEKQIQIANYIAGIRTQAKQLQQEANAIAEAAKREVERILLEGVSC